VNLSSRRHPSETNRVPAERLAQQLRDGGRLLGTFIQIPSHNACETIALSGAFDFLCIDAEHSPFGRTEVESTVRVITLASLPCLVRVASHDPAGIAAALDAGAAGVIVPKVETRTEAAEICQAARYPPRGSRGVGPSRATSYGLKINEYVASALANTIVCVQIETQTGLANLEEILTVEDVDLIFVGPGDLALSLASLNQDVDLPQEIANIQRRSSATRKLTGIFATTMDAAEQYFAQAFDLVVLGSDLGFLQSGLAQITHC
jgi:4-hydroxy-2-oxoheptanedioate aldolase